jgi:Putative Ig domain
MTKWLVIAVVSLCFASCLALSQTLQIQPLPGQGAIVGQTYVLALNATGGVAPYTWRVVGGQLPPGTRLQAHAGKISGVPTAAGDYHVTVSLTDSDIPASQLNRDLTIHVIDGLSINWNDPPMVQGNAIKGSAAVTNQTPNELDVTVVIVAVNETGRATALGYQHFTLPANATSPVIAFGSSPGNGTYYVRADAVAHRPGKHSIYRVNKQADGIKLAQF